MGELLHNKILYRRHIMKVQISSFILSDSTIVEIFKDNAYIVEFPSGCTVEFETEEDVWYFLEGFVCEG